MRGPVLSPEVRAILVRCFALDGKHCASARAFYAGPSVEGVPGEPVFPEDLTRDCDAARAVFLRGGGVL